MSGIFTNLLGTTKDRFQLGILGVILKSVAGKLHIRNADDTGGAEIVLNKLSVSGKSIDLNSEATGINSDFRYSLLVPNTGMTASVSLTLPALNSVGNLHNDGNGNLSWSTSGGSSLDWTDTDLVQILTQASA